MEVERGRGRPCLLTPEVQEKLVEAIELQAYMDDACAYAGIDYTTFRKWIQRGETATEGKFFDLVEVIKKAQAEATIKNLKTLDLGSIMHWQAAAWMLERRHPEKYGKRLRVSGDEKNPIKVTHYRAEIRGGHPVVAESEPETEPLPDEPGKILHNGDGDEGR